jgi:putative ABC transport system permease protein
MWNLYIKSAWRSLLRQRLVTGINLIGLSVGMAVSVLIFLWVRNELSYDSAPEDVARIYRLTAHLGITKGETWAWESIPANLGDMAQKELTGIDRMGSLMANTDFTLATPAQRFFKSNDAAFVDKGWLDLFPRTCLSGSLSAFLNDPRGLALTRIDADKYFGSANPIGQVLILDKVPFTVRAIVGNNPTNSSFQFGILINRASRLLDSNQRKNDASWGDFNYITFVKLARGTDLRRFEARLVELYRQARKGVGGSVNTTTFTLLPLLSLHFDTETMMSAFRKGDRKTVYILGVLGILLLGIACINYVNLTTARAAMRAKEVGVRKTLGARKSALFGQFLSETALLSLLALLLTLVWVKLSIPFFNDLTGEHFAFSLVSGPMIFVVLGTLATTIVLSSLYPALLLSSFQPMKVLRGTGGLRLKDGPLRKVLVVAQFSITLVVLTGTFVISGQMRYVREHSPVFEQSSVFQFEFPSGVWQQYNYDFKKIAGVGMAFRNELLQAPEIASVSAASEAAIDLRGMHSGNLDYDGRSKDFNPSWTQISADREYLSMFHLEMKEGEWPKGYNKDELHHFVINETAARQWNIHKPLIGQRLVVGGDTGIISGIVKDFHFQSFHDQISPLVVTSADGSDGVFIIRAAAGKNPQALAVAQKVWAQFFPGEPFDYVFVKDTFDKLYKPDMSAFQLFQVFSWVAVLLSALGLFGLAAFVAAQRTKEIGIRKVLGATVANLVVLLSTDFVRLVGVAIGIGTPLAWWAGHTWLEGFAYRIDLGWGLFAGAAMLSLGIALATVSVHAIRAALTNPVHNLRTE